MDNRKELMSDIYEAPARPALQLPPIPKPLPPDPPKKSRKILKLIIGLALTAAILFYGVRGLVVKEVARNSIELIRERISQAKQALVAFDISGAEEAFIDIKRIVADIQHEASRYGLLSLAEVISVVYPPLSEAPQALSILDRLSDKVLSIIRLSETLKTKAFDWMVSGQGKTLIGQLTKLRTEVEALGGILEEMKENAASLDYPIGDDVLAFRAELYQSEQILEAAIGWLSDVNHIAILFVNPSEIRPAGGFPGSYAAVTIAQGSLGDITVKDIYDPDGQLSLKITPPKQLQLITDTWGARDANWFFDFPTSARKTLFFLNNSKIYTDQNLELSALIAVNVNVVSDILKVIGPIEMPEYKLTLTGENFLDEVQREVRSGNDRTSGEPKRILKTLTPILLKRLGALSDTQKHDLISRIKERFAAKDMMAYIEDPVMQAYLEQLGVAGEVEQSQEGDLNEYLAVVNANIGGGKTDAVMSQSITLKSRIDLEGKISNDLSVKRTHSGKSSSAAWYNVTNKDFIQIFAPRGSRATLVRGNDIAPSISRSTLPDYSTDSDLAAIEGSAENLSSLGINQTIAFNKTVFSTWLNTAPGTTRTLELQYVNTQKLTPHSSADYQFIFQKQSGVDTALTFTIDAPPEYKWKENSNSTFTYTTKSAPGELKINLTLIPIR